MSNAPQAKRLKLSPEDELTLLLARIKSARDDDSWAAIRTLDELLRKHRTGPLREPLVTPEFESLAQSVVDANALPAIVGRLTEEAGQNGPALRLALLDSPMRLPKDLACIVVDYLQPDLETCGDRCGTGLTLCQNISSGDTNRVVEALVSAGALLPLAQLLSSRRPVFADLASRRPVFADLALTSLFNIAFVPSLRDEMLRVGLFARLADSIRPAISAANFLAHTACLVCKFAPGPLRQEMRAAIRPMLGKLQRMLLHPESKVRQDAACAMVHLSADGPTVGSLVAVPGLCRILIELALHDGAPVARNALTVLSRILERGHGEALVAVGLLPALVAVLANSNRELHRGAARCISRVAASQIRTIVEERVLPALIVALRKSQDPLLLPDVLWTIVLLPVRDADLDAITLGERSEALELLLGLLREPQKFEPNLVTNCLTGVSAWAATADPIQLQSLKSAIAALASQPDSPIALAASRTLTSFSTKI